MTIHLVTELRSFNSSNILLRLLLHGVMLMETPVCHLADTTENINLFGVNHSGYIKRFQPRRNQTYKTTSRDDIDSIAIR